MTSELSSTNFGEIDRSLEQTANFNDPIFIKITPAGEIVRNEHYIAIGLQSDALPPLERDEEGFTKMQLWEVAKIFGAYMYSGNPSPPIEMIFKLVK